MDRKVISEKLALFLQHVPKLCNKKRAIVFVDYEYWFISYKNLYKIKPDLKGWYEGLSRQYEQLDIYFFADFTGNLKNELPEIRKITNHIVETRNKNERLKKDMTDFVMLDYIYQMGTEKRIPETIVIVSGDGHFQSVVRYLVTKLKKTVIVYGVMHSFSQQLKEAATEIVELPSSKEQMGRYMQMVIHNMAYVVEHPKIIATFTGTEKAVARKNQVPEEKIRATLNIMLEKNYLYKHKQYVDFNKQIPVLAANWDLLIKEGLYVP